MKATPKWFKVVAFVALLWNLLGCVAFVSELRLTPEAVSKLSAAQQAMYAARPIWSVAATGVAVVGGALGCIGLILCKRWAYPLLGITSRRHPPGHLLGGPRWRYVERRHLAGHRPGGRRGARLACPQSDQERLAHVARQPTIHSSRRRFVARDNSGVRRRDESSISR